MLQYGSISKHYSKLSKLDTKGQMSDSICMRYLRRWEVEWWLAGAERREKQEFVV